MIYWNRDYYRYGIAYNTDRFLHLRNGERVSYTYSSPTSTSDVIINGDEVLISDMLYLFDGLHFYFNPLNTNIFEYDVYYYADGDIWKPLLLTLDETNYWAQDGKIEFDIPSDWASHIYPGSTVASGFCIKFVFKNVTSQSSVTLSSGGIHIRNLVNVLEYTDIVKTIEEIYLDSQASLDQEVIENFRKSYDKYDVDYGLIVKDSSQYGYLYFENCIINFGESKKPGALNSIGGLYLKTDRCIMNIDIPGYQYNFSPNYLSEIKNTRIFINQKSASQRLAIRGAIIGEQKTLFKNFEWNYGYLFGTYKFVDSVINPRYFFTNFNCEYENLTIISKTSLDPSYAIYQNIKFDVENMWLLRYTPNLIDRVHVADIIDCEFPNNNDYNVDTSTISYQLSSTNTIWKHSIDIFIKTNTFEPISNARLSIKDVNGFDSIFLLMDFLLENTYSNTDTQLQFNSDISQIIEINDILLIEGELIKIIEIISNDTVNIQRGQYWSIPHYFRYISNKIYKQTEFIYSNNDGTFDEDIKLIYHTRCTGTDLGGIFRDKEEHLSPFTIRIEKEGFLVQENIIETIPKMKIYNQMAVDLSQETIIVGGDTKLLTNRIAGGVENG